jgi:hypothetical protein
MTPFSGLLGDDLDTESAAETTGPGKPRKNAIDALFETAETPQQPAPRRNAIDALFENPKAPVPAPAAKPDALGSMRSRTPHTGTQADAEAILGPGRRVAVQPPTANEPAGPFAGETAKLFQPADTQPVRPPRDPMAQRPDATSAGLQDVTRRGRRT